VQIPSEVLVVSILNREAVRQAQWSGKRLKPDCLGSKIYVTSHVPLGRSLNLLSLSFPSVNEENSIDF
jgi:hypothetical protein